MSADRKAAAKAVMIVLGAAYSGLLTDEHVEKLERAIKTVRAVREPIR